MKAIELSALSKTGVYVKSPQEDISSIATGISGYKGHVHLSVGKVLNDDFETPDDIAKWLDKEIISLYVLHPTNFFAYEQLYGHYPKGVYSDKKIPFDVSKLTKEKQRFDAHINATFCRN